MPRNTLNSETIVIAAATIANEVGLENLSLQMIADALKVKSPSLYNHVSGLDDIKQRLMLYGWKQAESQMIQAATGVSGYDALRNMCCAFYDFATTNQGVFAAMLWYNKYQNADSDAATKDLFLTLFKIMRSLNLSDENINHVIRTFRSFLEGYVLLVNNHAFGNPLKVRESFEISLEIVLTGIKALEADNKQQSKQTFKERFYKRRFYAKSKN